MNKLHAIRVKVLPPTATKGYRLKLSSAEFGGKVTLDFSLLPIKPELSNSEYIAQEAMKYLNDIDLMPVYWCKGDDEFLVIVLCEEFDWQPK